MTYTWLTVNPRFWTDPAGFWFRMLSPLHPSSTEMKRTIYSSYAQAYLRHCRPYAAQVPHQRSLGVALQGLDLSFVHLLRNSLSWAAILTMQLLDPQSGSAAPESLRQAEMPLFAHLYDAFR